MYVKPLSPTRIKIAWAIAVGADFVEIVLCPLFAEGFASILADGLDAIVCLMLTWLVGWHFAFLPSFLVKVLPVVDMAPTWTLAIFVATRKKIVSAEPPVTEIYSETVAPPQLNAPVKEAKE